MENTAFSSALYRSLLLDLGVAGSYVCERFGEISVPVCSDADTKARYSLLQSIFKKSEEEVDPQAENRTLLAFLEANAHCKAWTIPAITESAIGYSISYARLLLKQWLEPLSGTQMCLNMASIESFARFGPGASSGMDKDRPTQYYFKVGDQPLTYSSDFIYSWYQLSVRNNPLCEAAELARKARCGWADGVVNSKLGFVPKSYRFRRITVTEPSLNTYFQLGAGAVLERALKASTGIDFSCQASVNSELARVGSLTQEFSTIDLKQCSDYISQGLVGYMFPKSARQWFNILRTRQVEVPGLGMHELFMTGTMGNGFTFPMQTMLLTALLLGVYKTLDIKPVRPCSLNLGNYGVFGDDVICRTEAYDLYTRCLKTLGMIVNVDKSFASGPFRESCGADFYNGTNVRGVYIHRYSTRQDYISIFNRLAIWSATHRIPLSETLRFLMVLLEDDRDRLVPPDESLVSGVILPIPAVEKDGWVYQRYVPVVSPFRLETWEYIQIEAERYREVGTRTARRDRWLKALEAQVEKFGGSLNEPAILKTLLFGGIRRGSMVTRALRPSYKSVVSYTPRWGYTEQPLCQHLDRDQIAFWNQAVKNALEAS